jgi:hypothetical protein
MAVSLGTRVATFNGSVVNLVLGSSSEKKKEKGKYLVLPGPHIDSLQLIIGHTFLNQGGENTLGASCLAATVNDNTHDGLRNSKSDGIAIPDDDLGNWRCCKKQARNKGTCHVTYSPAMQEAQSLYSPIDSSSLRAFIDSTEVPTRYRKQLPSIWRDRLSERAYVGLSIMTND